MNCYFNAIKYYIVQFNRKTNHFEYKMNYDENIILYHQFGNCISYQFVEENGLNKSNLLVQVYITYA